MRKEQQRSLALVGMAKERVSQDIWVVISRRGNRGTCDPALGGCRDRERERSDLNSKETYYLI